jgi:hypothetical protein
LLSVCLIVSQTEHIESFLPEYLALGIPASLHLTGALFAQVTSHLHLSTVPHGHFCAARFFFRQPLQQNTFLARQHVSQKLNLRQLKGQAFPQRQ